MKQRDIKRKMKRNGFILIRESNHLIFKHIVTGTLVTTPKSPRNNKFYDFAKSINDFPSLLFVQD